MLWNRVYERLIEATKLKHAPKNVSVKSWKNQNGGHPRKLHTLYHCKQSLEYLTFIYILSVCTIF